MPTDIIAQGAARKALDTARNPIIRLPSFGDSYVAGSGATSTVYSFMERVASTIGAELANYGIGATAGWLSSVGASQNSRVFREIPNDAVIPYDARFPVSVVRATANDLLNQSAIDDGVTSTTDSLMASIDRLRAGGVWDCFTGTGWTFNQGGGASNWSGPVAVMGIIGARYAQSAGNYAEFTVPADVPAGSTFQFVAACALGHGATWAVTKNSVAQPGWVTSGRLITGAIYSPTTYRITAGGGDVIRFTATALGTSNQGWLLHAQVTTSTPGLVVVLNMNRFIVYATGFTHNPTHAEVLARAAAVTAMVAATYPTGVVVVDVDAAMNGLDPTYFAADNTHPNDRGHAAIAAAVIAAIRARMPSAAAVSAHRQPPRNQAITRRVDGSGSDPRVFDLTLVAGVGVKTSFGIAGTAKAHVTRRIAAGTALGQLTYALVLSSLSGAGTITVTSKKASDLSTETGDLSTVNVEIYNTL